MFAGSSDMLNFQSVNHDKWLYFNDVGIDWLLLIQIIFHKSSQKLKVTNKKNFKLVKVIF